MSPMLRIVYDRAVFSLRLTFYIQAAKLSCETSIPTAHLNKGRAMLAEESKS